MCNGIAERLRKVLANRHRDKRISLLLQANWSNVKDHCHFEL